MDLPVQRRASDHEGTTGIDRYEARLRVVTARNPLAGVSAPEVEEPDSPDCSPPARPASQLTAARAASRPGYLVRVADLVGVLVATLAVSAWLHPWALVVLALWLGAGLVEWGCEVHLDPTTAVSRFLRRARSMTLVVAVALGGLALVVPSLARAESPAVLGGLLVAVAVSAGARLIAAGSRATAPLTVLVVGEPDAVVTAVRAAATRGERPDVVGYCAARATARSDTAARRLVTPAPSLGLIDDVRHQVDRLRPHEVLVLPGALSPVEVHRLTWSLEGSGTRLILDLGADAVAPQRLVPVRHLLGTGAQVRPSALSASNGRLRAALDRVLALVLVVLALPLVVLIVVAVRLDSRGPAFFVQRRVGLRGATFSMFKFRTMGIDAEVVLEELAGSHDGNDVLFKLRRDPRVTRVGRVLRASSLDELPQLLNVVRGEMALVGPRPALPREVAQYDVTTMRRLDVKPGVTGLWQVSGRSNLSWEESVRLDLDYVDNWSLRRDVGIAVRTVKAVVTRDGAY